jgi:hypothetical protein
VGIFKFDTQQSVINRASIFFADIQGWWSTGFSYGLWIAALVSSGFSVVPVASQTWKAYFGLSRSESPKVSHSCYVEHTVALSRNSLAICYVNHMVYEIRPFCFTDVCKGLHIYFEQ